MRKSLFGRAFLLALILAFSYGCGNVAANLAQQNDPPQAPQQTQAGQLAHIFTLTTSSPATYSTPSGALELMPSTSLIFQSQAPGFLTVSFSARGSVAPSGGQSIPIVFIECHIDGQACQPDGNTVDILWGMGNPTAAIVTNRSLIVETATP